MIRHDAMTTPSLPTRYTQVDALWLPFWGHSPAQQVLAGFAFFMGLMATALMWPFEMSTSTLMAWVGAMAALLHRLTRIACSQLTQALVVLRLAPTSASRQVWRRWRTHLWAVGLSLGGSHGAMLIWKAALPLLALWGAMVLLGAVALAVQHAARVPHRKLWLMYGGGVLLGGLMLADDPSPPWMETLIAFGLVAVISLLAISLRHSGAQLRRGPPQTMGSPATAAPWRARWRAWWQRWTFLAQPPAQNSLLAPVGSTAGLLPALMLLDWLPKADTPILWKHLCMLLWMALFLKDLVVCRDLHWRTWLAPKRMARQHLGWRVWRDTLKLFALFMGLPALIWLGISLQLDHPLNWTAIGTATVMALLATTVAVWVVGRHLQSPHRMALELVVVALLAGLGWFAQAQLGLPGQLDLLTQALPLAAAVMAIALWRIDRVWQRADVYALAHRQPEPTGWEID